MSSSRSVLHRSRGGQRGLQQYFAPLEAAQLIARVFGSAYEPVLDLTAGNGALLAPYEKACRFGVEIDRDHIAAGDYTSIRGDIQQIYPLLRCAGVRFGQIALNPPFGLDWADPLTGKAVNSTVLAYRYAQGLLTENGQGALIAGRDRFYNEIVTRPDGHGVYAVIETESLFSGAELPIVIAFFVAPNNRPGESGLLEFKAKKGGLAKGRLVTEIISQREASCGPTDPAAIPENPGMRKAFAAAQREHTRRRKARKKPNDHDLYLRGRGSLDERKWHLLLNKGAAADVALDGQLIDEPEPPTDWAQVITEMIEAGAEINGDEVPEKEVKSLWDRIVPLQSVINPESAIVTEGPAPMPRSFGPIKPLKSFEQLSLLAGATPPAQSRKRRSRSPTTAGR